jgi:quercetin dioxygenase-like cupin family protein
MAITNADHLYEVERRVRHAERSNFRISELQISPSQFVPWHCHTRITDTFYVIEGSVRLLLRDPAERDTAELRRNVCGPRRPSSPR